MHTFLLLTLQAARVRRQEEERDVNGTNGGDSSRGSTPTPVPPGADRVTSPPIPAIRNSQGGGNSSNNSEFESGSMGLSSDDDQVQNQYILTQYQFVNSTTVQYILRRSQNFQEITPFGFDRLEFPSNVEIF